jgi:hypothetical protein
MGRARAHSPRNAAIVKTLFATELNVQFASQIDWILSHHLLEAVFEEVVARHSNLYMIRYIVRLQNPVL